MDTYQFLINDEGIIKEYSSQCSQLINGQSSEFKGGCLRDVLVNLNADWADILPEDFSDPFPPLYLPWTTRGNSLATGLTVHALPTAHGTYITLIPSLAPYEELKNSSIRDISWNAVLIEQLFLRLQTAESRIESYTHNFPGIFFNQRADLSFSFIGAGFERLLGSSPDPLYSSGNRFLEMIRKKDGEAYIGELKSRSEGGKTFSSLVQIHHPESGNILYLLEVRTPQLSPSGILLGYDGVWLDLTRQVIAEKRLANAGWKENISTLTVGLVHDFNNLISGIHSLSELYSSSLDKNDRLYRGMEMIRSCSLDSQQMVRRILELNREVVCQKNFHNVEELIGRQMDLISLIFPKKTTIVTQFTGKEFPVYLDEVGFRQTMLNLAINSRDAIQTQGKIFINVKYAEKGEKIFKRASGGSFEAPKDGVEIQFRDNGCGIDEEQIGKLFDPYFTTKDNLQGSGLGLYNAELFIEENGGNIAVGSELEKGTTFFIYFPLADMRKLPLSEVSELKTEHYFKERPRFAVYAKQEPHQLSLVSEMRNLDWEVITFNDHEQMTRYLREAQVRPEVVILIEIGNDEGLMDLTNSIRQIDPRIKLALQIFGRNPDELESELKENADLFLTGADRTNEILDQLAALLIH